MRRIIVKGVVVLLLLVLIIGNMNPDMNVESEELRTGSRGHKEPGKAGSSWPMFRHDASHSGNTSAVGPTTNAISWVNSTDSYIEGSPVVADDRVYIGSWDKYMYCFDADTGDRIWRFLAGNKITSTPVVHDDKVFFNSGETRSHCLYANNGTPVWSESIGSTASHRAYTSPTVIHGIFYTSTSQTGKIDARYAGNGSLIWSAQVGSACSSVAVANDLVYVGSSADNNLSAVYANNGTVKWKYSAEDYIHSSPSVVDDRLYVGSEDTYLHCINAITGDFIWKYKTGKVIQSSPACDGDRVYVGSDDGKMYCIDSSGNLNWSYKTGSPIYSSPAIADGKIYFGGINKKVYCLYADNGTLDWNHATEGAIYSSPAIADGRLFIASRDGKVFCFGGNDTTRPEVEMTNPMNHTTNVPVTGEISITFSEDMDRTSVENAISTAPVMDHALSWDGRVLTLAPVSDLEFSTEYVITMGNEAKDLSGNPMEKGYDFCFTTEEEPDTIPPEVMSTFPLHDSANVSVSTTISMGFSEPMIKVFVENAVSVLPALDYQFSWEDQILTLGLVSELEYSTRYTITIGTGAKDMAGNPMAEEHSFSFTSEEKGDKTSPEILLTIPRAGETRINVNATISLTFSENMNHTSVETTIRITPSIDYTISWDGNVLTLFPDTYFAYLTSYTVIIGTGAMDKADNPMVEEFQFYFTTEKQDTVPPLVEFAQPALSSKDVIVSITITITFSESMNSTSVETAISTVPGILYDISWNENRDVLGLTAVGDLDFETTYTVNISTEAMDLAGNRLETPFSLTFTTEEEPDTTPPAIMSTNPGTGESDVGLDTTISIEFSEAMDHLSMEEALVIFPPCYHTSSWSKNTITIILEDGLNHGTIYTVSVGTGAKDLAGNFLEVEYLFTFTTEADATPPVIRAMNPSDDETGVQIDTAISIGFSEAMNQSSVIASIAIVPSMDYDHSWNGNTITISPTTDLEYATRYTITIDAQAEDLAGNDLKGVFSLSFITRTRLDTSPPSISSEPVIETRKGEATYITAIITDNTGVKNVILYYREKGTDDFAGIPMVSQGNEYRATIPGSEARTTGLEYYIWATDGANNVTYPGDDAATNLHEITVLEEGEGKSQIVLPILLGIIGVLLVLLLTVNLWYDAIEQMNRKD